MDKKQLVEQLKSIVDDIEKNKIEIVNAEYKMSAEGYKEITIGVYPLPEQNTKHTEF